VQAIALSFNVEVLTREFARAITLGWPTEWKKPKIIFFQDYIPHDYADQTVQEHPDPKSSLIPNIPQQLTETSIKSIFYGFDVFVITVPPSNKSLKQYMPNGPRFWVQDAFVLLFSGTNETIVHLKADEYQWPNDTQNSLYRIKEPKVILQGGDLFVLDNIVLIGATILEYRRRSQPNFLEICMADHVHDVWTTIHLPEPVAVYHDIGDLKAIMGLIQDRLAYPFYHLDLY